jgi:RNA-directed DNA polymerase
MEQCFNALSRTNCPQWVLEGDIKSCFDKIGHDRLPANVPTDKAILRKWLKSGYMEKHVFYNTTDGTPQGGIISPVLANLALDGLERMLKRKYPHVGNRATQGRNQQVNLIRYADDFILTGKTKEVLEDEVKPMVEAFMRERGLELSQEKTVITHVEDGFDFLGQNVRKFNGTLLIQPSKKNVKTFLNGIREVIRKHQQATAYGLIVLLNPKIRGWGNYHRRVASKETFQRVDSEIFKMLWRWAVRRHPKKPRRWIRKKYFGSKDGRNWRFFGIGKDGKGNPIQNWIGLTMHIPIRRHRKVKSDANPYDPACEVYFEERLGLKMAAHLHGRKQLSRLWKEQKGLCPLCCQPITKLTKWHNHHLIQRVKGGPDVGWNRMLLHPDCHRQLHAKGLSVSKPRPLQGV